MKKVIHPCDVPVWNGKGKKYPLFCEIEFTDGNLSITGVIGPTKSGNAMGACGQVDSEFWHPTIRKETGLKPSQLRFADGWTREKWLKFLRYWHEWHLNDMHAECEHQQAMGWKYETHPMFACPVCGYKLGSAWTKREVPAWVIQFLEYLPDTDREPNWV